LATIKHNHQVQPAAGLSTAARVRVIVIPDFRRAIGELAGVLAPGPPVFVMEWEKDYLYY
jgi:hypothetical protein